MNHIPYDLTRYQLTTFLGDVDVVNFGQINREYNLLLCDNLIIARNNLKNIYKRLKKKHKWKFITVLSEYRSRLHIWYRFRRLSRSSYLATAV